MTDPLLQARKKTFGKAIGTLTSKFRRCYAPGDSCEGEPIRAHSVQNSGMLELLQRDGHVVAPRLEMAFATGPRVEFALLGRNQATTFHGLCGDHDRDIFSPIETQELDLQNPEHLFLLSYRAVLKETHATAKSAIDTQSGYVAGVENGLLPEEPCAPGFLAVQHMMLAHQTHMHKLRYDAAYVNSTWNVLGHNVRDLEAPPGLAVNALLSCGRFSNETDSLAYATLNVFPHSGTTFLVFSYLAAHRRHFNRSFARFIASGNVLEQISYLVLKRCENFVLSPAIYDQFSEQQRAECTRFYVRNIGEHEYEPENPRLIYLFGAR